jgi:type IV pilus assembly protein PilP
VQAGNYAGQNYGKITRVTEYEVELTEIVPDGIGGWMERQATIAISE